MSNFSINNLRMIKALFRRTAAVLFLLVPFFQLLAQNGFRVSGKVSSDQGEALAGVTIRVRNGSATAVSGVDGSFAITVPAATSVLMVSHVGFTAQDVPVGNKAQLTISMTAQNSSLQDVVVVGYGTQKKSDVTGAVSRITADDIQERPVQNVLQAVQGKAAGVQVTSNIKPGELPVVRVRGNRSLGASNDPLYVVDGIPIVNALGVSSFSISDLNPNDIASMEILKDASATAIYGSRGANGVVIITTNKGKKGRATLSYNATVSLDSYKSLTDWMDGGEYIDRWRLALINGRQYQTTTNADLSKPADMWYPDPRLDATKMGITDPTALKSLYNGYEWDVYGVTPKTRPPTAAEQAMGWPAAVPVYNSKNIRSYDWLGAAVRTGVTQNHQLSVTAGSDISRLSLSLGYYNQTGVQRDQDYKRYNVNLQGDITPTKWFTLGASLITSFSRQNYGIQGPNTSNTGSKDLYSRASDQFPFALPRDSAGVSILNPGNNLSLYNPLIDITQSINERRTLSALGSLFAEVKFTPWLKYRVNFGPQYRSYRAGSWTGPSATSHLTNRPNTASYATQENFSWVVENLLFVDKSFTENHKIGITLLQSSQRSRRENASQSVNGLINPLSLWYNLSSNTTGTPASYGSGFTENQLSSFMGRFNYTLFDRYLFTATGRADGSSVLAPGHKWDFFPSAAVAWKMQEENFFKDVTWLDELKLRFGYGVTGNSSVDPYTTSGPLSQNPYIFGTTAAIGFLPQLVQNPLLRWEKTAQSNLGVDFTLMANRLSGTVEVYEQNTSDLILPKTLPAVSGYVTKYENIGKTRNRGIEITLSGVPVKAGKFTWNLDVNWTRNKEQILELLNGRQDMVANGWFIGQPLQVFRQYDNAGIWGNAAKQLADQAKFNANGLRFYPGTIHVVDQNGDSKIDANDYVIRGTPRPKWTGGITNTFTYGDWSLNAFVYLRWGQTYFGGYPNSYGGIYPNGRVENDVWSWTNPGGKWPMPNTGNVDNFTSAMQYNNGSFGVVRNISVSYNLPRKLIQKAGIKSLVLNAQVLNPFIFGPGVVKWGINPDDDTNWSVASSNTNPLGGTNNNTILPQSWMFGLRAGF